VSQRETPNASCADRIAEAAIVVEGRTRGPFHIFVAGSATDLVNQK
jgi:hypothetical protein